MSADPMLAAGVMSAAAPSPSAIEEKIFPDSNQTGLAAGVNTQVADIFAGVVQEDLAFPPEPPSAEAAARDGESQMENDKATAHVAQSQTVGSGSPSTPSATQTDASIASVAQDGPSIAEQLTETLRAANGPPEAASQVTLGAQAPILPGLQFLGGGVESLAGQVFYLDFDGASGVTYHGPVVVEGINVPAFNLSASGLGGQEDSIISSVVAALNERFSQVCVSFTTTRPRANSDFSTIYVGGGGLEFAQYGAFNGLAEKLDVGNEDKSDKAFVFSERLADKSGTSEWFLARLTDTIAHEIGHLLGYSHSHSAATTGPSSKLDELAAADLQLVDVTELTQVGTRPAQAGDPVLAVVGAKVGDPIVGFTLSTTAKNIGTTPINWQFPVIETSTNPWIVANQTANQVQTGNPDAKGFTGQERDATRDETHYHNVAGSQPQTPDENEVGPHPHLQFYLYRWVPGAGTMLIGQSDLKHTYYVGIERHGNQIHYLLSPVVQDDYSKDHNQDQSFYGPVSEMDPLTFKVADHEHMGSLYNSDNNQDGSPDNGDFTYRDHGELSFLGGSFPDGTVMLPDPGHPGKDNIDHLLQARVSDLDPSLYPPGTLWFLAASYFVVGEYDSVGNGKNQANNEFWVEITPTLKGSTLFAEDDFIGLSGLVARLKSHPQSDPVSVYLWNKFSSPSQQVLMNPLSTPQQQRSTLVAALNQILQQGNSIYVNSISNGVSAFAGVTLPTGISQNLTGEALTGLNRLLIQQAFPVEMAKRDARFTFKMFSPGEDPLTHERGSDNSGHWGPGLSTLPGTLINPVRAIGDRVFLDANQDGIGQSWELGVGGVTVTLWKDDGDSSREPTSGAGGDFQDATTITDVFGSYIFKNLDPAASYFVEFQLPNGYAFTPVVNAKVNNVPDGPNGNSRDEDINSDVELMPVGGHYVTRILPPRDSADLTVDAGLVTGVMGLVFRDRNGDSIWNPGEYIVKDVQVKLYDNGTGTLVAETKTDEAGRYAFFANGQTSSMLPTGAFPLAAGNYYVEFRAPLLNSFVTANVNTNGGTETTDSDVVSPNGRKGSTQVFSLGAPGLGHLLDAGVRRPLNSLWQAIKNIFQSNSNSGASLLPTAAVNQDAVIGKDLGVATHDTHSFDLANLLKNSPGPDLGDLLGLDIPLLQHLGAVFAAGDEPTEDTVPEAMKDYIVELLGSSVTGHLASGDSVTVTAEFDDASEELRFAVNIDASKFVEYNLNFNQLAALSISGTVPLTVEATFKLDFVLGFSLSDFLANPTAPASLTAQHVFVRLNNFKAAADIVASDIDASVNLGFLAAGIENGTLALQASVVIGLVDLTPADGDLTLANIIAGGFNLNVTPTGSMHAELPITASLGSTNLTSGCNPRIILDDPNLFANPPPVLSTQGFDCLTDFSNITATQAVAMLKRLGDWLKTYRDSEFFDLELPFTGGKRVGDWFDSGTAFVDSIYKRMIRREIVATGTQTADFRTSGQLTADAHFRVIVGTDAPVSVTVSAASTASNSALDHAAADFNLALPTALAAKVEFRINSDGRLSLALKDGQTADVLKLEAVSASDAVVTEAGFVPMQGTTTQDSTVTQLFSTIQSFVTRLNEVLSPLVITPAYDSVAKEVTMGVHFDWHYTKTAPVNLGGDLGPIASFSTTAEFNVAAALTFDFTLGFALKPKNTPQLITTAFVPPPSDGKLHADSSFYVIVGTDAPVLVTLSAASTSANNSLASLAAYLNTRLTAAGLGSKVRASVTSANHLALAVINEDRDGDSHLDAAEDLDGDGKLDRIEDLDGDGRLDVFEDLNGDGVLQSWEDADHDGHLDVKEDFDGDGLLGTVNEDADHDGRLDVAEDTLIVNNMLDSHLGVQTLRIVAEANDPIYTEVGFLPETARAEARGLFLDNAKISGALSVSLTGITASAHFSIFGIQVTGGSASGSVTLDAMLRNRAGTARRVPLDELFAAANAGALGQVLSNSSALNTQPKFTGSLNLTLPISVSFPGLTLPNDAKIIIAIPDITKLKDNSGQLAIHAGTDLAVPANPGPGIWLIYPNLDGLFHFSCLDIPTYILALDNLVQDLGKLSAFSFLNKPLPLINQSFSQLIGQVGKLAQWVNDVRSDPGDTLTALETKLETALGIDPSLFTLTIDDVPNPSLAPNGTAVFNPQGVNNALRFTNTTASNITVRILDEGTITGTTSAATAVWDSGHNTLTIEVNSGYTTAANVTSAVSTSGAPVTVAPDTTTTTGDGTANNGSGVITKTALKLHFNYTLAYGIQRPFELSLADLVPLLPPGSPAVALLAGLTSFIDVEGTGKLNISAGATLTIDFGLDVTNPCAPPRPFLYDTTALTLKGRVTATDLDFKAALGPLGIFVVNGSAAFDKDGNADTADDAEFRLSLADSPSGRYYLGSGSNFFSTSSNFELAIEAGLGVTLPLFFPTQSLPFGGSMADANNDGYADNYFVVIIPDLKRVFVEETTAFNSATGFNEAVVTFPGANNDLLLRAPLNAGAIKIHFLEPANPSTTVTLNGTTLEVPIDSSVTTASQVMALTFPAGYSAMPHVATEISGTNDGSGKVYTRVTIITPDFNSLFPSSFDICTLIQSSGVLLDGLDELLGKIEGGFDKVAASGNFPLVGNKLAQGANFIRSFRSGLLGDLRRKLATVGGDPINLVKQAIWNVLGQPGLDILVHPDTGLDTLAGWSDLDIQCIHDNTGAGTEVRFNLRLKKVQDIVDTTANPISIDLGLPSLGLEINGSVQIKVGFDLRLKFGINKTDGFYFNTDNPAVDPNNPEDTDFVVGGRPELIVDLTVTVPGLDVTGTLFFLQLNAKDGHTAHIGHTAETQGNAPSNLTGRFTVDVVDSDLKLTFNNMRSGGFSFDNTFKARFDLTAEVNLDLRITFGGDAAFPNIAAEFDLDWAWTSASSSAPTLCIAFHHITIDAGSYISNVLAPILRQVQKVTGPIGPIAHMLITPIPGLSDLSGNEVTFLDIAEGSGYLKPSTRKFIETVVKIIDIINQVGAATSAAGANALTFDLGDYVVTGDCQPANALGAMMVRPLQQQAPPANPGIISALRGVLSDLRELGFEFPILSLGEIIKLMQGKPATIVEYHMPVLYFSFTYAVSISLYPPFATLVVGGTVSATIDLTFGFDTYGLPIYKKSHNVLDLLQGLYIKDTDSNGMEVPEVVLSGGIFVGVAGGVSFGPIEVLFGAGGGVFIDLEFDLNDPDGDGRVRTLEILANAKRDIRCIFDIHGRIYLVISMFLKVKAVVFKFEKQWDFPEIPLYEFDLTCPPPILAHTNGTQLVLHMGPNAHLREEIDTDDNSETFVVQHLGGTATSENVLVKWNGFQKEFDGISSIVADGGAGNDTIDARGVLSQVQFDGGTGDDTIYNSDNAASDIHGGANNDTLIGSAKVGNTMFGDDGNDTITGNVFNDVLHGNTGNDTITGNGGNDRLFGEEGNDMLTTLGGNDYLDGGPDSDALDAGEGDDRLYGNSGNDKLLGGRGNDWVVGGLGADTLDGGSGRDILVGDDAASITIKIGSGAVVTWNVAGASNPTTWDVSSGPGMTTWDVAGLAGAGDDLLIGEADEDVLFGCGGKDAMFGGALMASGVPTPIEQDGVDFMDGGADEDVEYADDAFAPVGVRPSGPTVSGRVWSDTNGDGVQNTSEPGMAGVTVELYKGTTSVLEDTVTTGTAGDYSFVGLHPGGYYVKFVKLDPAQAFSPKDVGSDDALDSDADTDAAIVPGKTAMFTLAATGGKSGLDAGLRGPPIVVIDDVTKAEGTLLGTTAIGITTYGTTAFTFTVSLSAPSAQTVTVNYTTANGVTHPAITGTDFSTASGTLTFTPGTTSLTITVLIAADNVYESSENFSVLLSNALEAGATDPLIIAKATGQGVIIEDDPKPTVSIDDAIGSALFSLNDFIGLSDLVAKLSNHSDPVSQYVWNQFSSQAQQVLTNPNSTAQQQRSTLVATLNQILQGNSIYDVSRFAGVTLSAQTLILISQNPTGGGLVRLNRLLIEQAYPLEIAKGRVTVTETPGGTVANFTLHLSNPSDQPITVAWTTADATNAFGEVTPDSAHFGADYTAGSGTVTFVPGVTKLVDAITVNILDDSLDEDGVSNDVTTEDGPNNRAEHFFIILGNSTNAGILDGFGNAAIKDDDAPPAVNISPAPVSVTEGDAGYHTAAFTISLTTPSALAVKVTWATARGTATDLGTSAFDQPDFLNDTGAVIFTPGGSLSQTITAKVLGDTFDEGPVPEYFFTNIIRADNATIGHNHAIVEISDDDTGADVGPWNVQFSDVKYTVREDAGFAAITLARAAGSSEAVAVFYTQDGSATNGLDYTSTRLLVNFTEDETEKTILIPILNDTLIEDTEKVNLFLRNPTGGFARGEFTSATLYILDDEPRPAVTIDDKIVTEADPISAGGTSDTQTVTFTFHLSAIAEIPINVPWSTNNRSAIGGFDYTTADGTATFGIHALTTTITVTVKNDNVAEPVEEFVINLGMPDQATLDDHQALGTIYDDDKTPISGRVFLDEDCDAYFDFFEHGLAGLQVMVTDYANTSASVTTDATGAWNTTVLMGATKVAVVEPGPSPGLPTGLITSTGNNPQTVTISDTVATAGDVGYKADLVPDVPPDAIGEGSGGLDDTVFGGGADDILNGGGGGDFLIGGHWLLGAGCACTDSAYDAHLEQADAMSRINLAAASRNDGGSISGRVFDDVNGNNFYDGSDSVGLHPLIAGVTVNLFDRDYALVASAVTDGNGNYSFSHLAGCDYSVQFVAPPGLRFVTPGVGSAATDSDADTFSGLTHQVPIVGTATASNLDGGVTALPPPSNGPWALSFGNSVYNVWEPDGLAQVRIERVQSSFEPLAVFFTSDGTATAGTDYTAVFRRLVDLSGAQNDIVLTLNVVPDGVAEGLETIRLFLRNPAGGEVTGQRPEAIVLIFDLRCTDNDHITGSHGDDVMLGDHGFVLNDRTVTQIGGSGNDTLRGGNGYDKLYGQGGNDRLDGGNGDDELVGSEGDDVYVFDTDTPAGTDMLTELPGAANGIDTIDFSPTTGVAVNVDLAKALDTTDPISAVQDVSVVGIVKHLLLTLSSGNAIENLIGGGANDTLLGNALNNVITGSSGSDTIDGRSGNDTLVEERDVDFVLTNTTLGVIAPAETDTLTDIERVELTGGSNNNRFDVSGWTGGPVSIDARAGTDTIFSTNDANFALTDSQLLRSPGVFFNLTSIENAILTGGAGNNTIDASAFTGSATLIGAAGDDTLLGGPGDNTYPFVADMTLGIDTIIDSSGNDTLDFSGTTAFGVTVDLSIPGPQVVNINLTLKLSNGSSIENVVGGALDDALTGNALANRITGASGNDTMGGGAGDDIYVFDADTALTSGAGHDTVTEAPGLANGVDTLDFSGMTIFAVTIDLSLTTDQVVVNGNLTLRLSGSSVIENVIGGEFNDRITGNDLKNTFAGGAGNDTYLFDTDTPLNSDTIVDSSGTDTLDFSGTTTLDVTVNLSNPGAQGVNNNLTLTLSNGSSIENVVGGAKNDTFTGNELNNMFTGGAGADTYIFDVDSALGADTIDETGGGNDTLDFSTTTTVAITVNLSVATQQTIPNSNSNPNLKLTLSQSNAIENIIGGGKNDVLTGNSLANRFEGGGGDDMLIGASGDDTYLFDADSALGADTIDESGGGNDTLDFSATTTVAITLDLSNAGQQSIPSLSPNLKLTLGAGNTIENVLGGSGNDIITGNTSNNRLDGRGGDDTYVFRDNWGSDIIVEQVGGGSDTLDFSQVSAGVTLNIQTTVAGGQGPSSATHAGEQIEKFIGTNSNDTFNVTPSVTSAFSVDGRNGTNDTLNFNASGLAVTSPANSITAAGRQPVTYSNFDNVNIIP